MQPKTGLGFRKTKLNIGNCGQFPRQMTEHQICRGDWRRERDSNPRYGFPHTRFPSVRLQPLGHLSVSGRKPGLVRFIRISFCFLFGNHIGPGKTQRFRKSRKRSSIATAALQYVSRQQLKYFCYCAGQVMARLKSSKCRFSPRLPALHIHVTASSLPAFEGNKPSAKLRAKSNITPI